MQTINAAIEKCLMNAKREVHSPAFVQSMLDEIFDRGYFVCNMEVDEIKNEDEWHPRIDLGIYGLEVEWETRAKTDAPYARQLVEHKLAMALECENQTFCQIWLDRQVIR